MAFVLARDQLAKCRQGKCDENVGRKFVRGTASRGSDGSFLPLLFMLKIYFVYPLLATGNCRSEKGFWWIMVNEEDRVLKATGNAASLFKKKSRGRVVIDNWNGRGVS